MARPRKNFGEHYAGWDIANNKVTIYPRYGGSTVRPTEKFGLGNAEIVLNLNKLPVDGIIVPITDDSSGAGILPTSPFKLSRWYAMPEGVNPVTQVVTGFNNWEMTLAFPQASAGSVKQVTAVTIIQNGYGVEEIVGDAPRLNW